jgi:hypothetical protein
VLRAITRHKVHWTKAKGKAKVGAHKVKGGVHKVKGGVHKAKGGAHSHKLAVTKGRRVITAVNHLRGQPCLRTRLGRKIMEDLTPGPNSLIEDRIQGGEVYQAIQGGIDESMSQAGSNDVYE